MISVNLDDIALMSPLRNKNTGLKIFVTLAGLVVSIASKSPVLPFFVAVCMMTVTLTAGKIPIRPYMRLVIPAMGFAFLSCIVIALFSGSAGGEILWSHDFVIYTMAVTTKSVNQAVTIFFRSFAGICCLFFLSMTTPMLEMFSGMKKIAFLDAFAELTMMIYRYIFVFLEMFLSIQSAQSMRFGYNGTKNAIRSAGMLVGTLLIRTIDQGDKLFLAMNSRCYDGKLAYHDTKKEIKVTDLILVAVFLISIAVVYSVSRNMTVF